MEEGDTNWVRARLRVEGNSLEEGDADWERAHLIGCEWCGGGRHRLGESALDRVGVVWRREMNARRDRTCKWKGMGERDEDWERAHLIWWEWCGGERCRLGESALESGRE